jgi:signal transduction histidine kinase
MSVTIPESRMSSPAAIGEGGWRSLRRVSGLWSPIWVAIAVSMAASAGLVLLAIGGALARNDFLASSALIVLLAEVLVMPAIGLRFHRIAEARTCDALNRASAAEASQRARADELARVLTASRGFALTNGAQVDYMSVLAEMTPKGSSSLLVCADADTDTEGTVVAAHGPLALSVVGTRRRLPCGGSSCGDTAEIASYSATGQTIGSALDSEGLAGYEPPVVAVLSIRMTGHDHRCLGELRVVDHVAERILEPGFVTLAQLVSSQIGVAMENSALLARVRSQLVEVRRVQEQLVQASKLSAIGELAAAVAHEVNNPLTGILGFAELLMGELPETDPRHSEAEVIRDEALRSRAIVKALLEFARPRPPQRLQSDVNELSKSALDLIRFRAVESGVKLVTSFGDLPGVAIDSDAVRQVLLNLFNNAVDAMPDGGELRLTTIAEADRVGIVVADVGVGMDDRTRQRIFAPFFSTRAGSGAGTGLGLSISLQIVESHGGSIDVDSKPGQGSVFTVWLPIRAAGFDGDVVIPADAATPVSVAPPRDTSAAA